MQIWSAEIKELESLYTSIRGRFPELEKELEQLIKFDDANVILLYSRRCLEIIVTDLCEGELKRPRKTEPLKGIIDKLHHEEKVPAYIITSMHGLNDLSTYGAHPKEFDPKQVKPVLNNLATIIEWYLKYKKSIETGVSEIKETDRITKQNGLEDTVLLQEQKTDNIFRTLWKRGIPQITAGYFIASWIIIRFLDWILARYNISTRWADVTLIILMAMIPSVLLYIYNRERINRGKLSLVEKITFPSNIIITIVLVLLLSKGTDLQAMTKTITVVNEFGEKENRKVFKEKYVTKLAIFPFTKETKDSLKNWLQYGIDGAIGEDLLQFNYVSFGWYNAIHLQEQIKLAKTNNFPHFLTGVFRITDNIYEITSRIYQTANGSIITERIFRGSDFFSLIDSISLQTRIDLGISNNILNSSPDLPFKEHFTDNLDAFGYYIKGFSIDSFYYFLNKAIKLDSTFAAALYERAFENYTGQRSDETARKDINQAMRHRQRLTELREISTRILYYSILGDKDKSIALAEMQYELQPNNINLLLRLIDTYQRNFMVYKFEKAAQRLNELVPDQPYFQIMLARSYLFTGKLDKGLEVLEKLLKDNPENTEAMLQMGEIYLHKNDLNAAEKVYQNATLLSPEDEKYWKQIFDHISYCRNNQIRKEILKPFTGHFQVENVWTSAESVENDSIFIFNNHCIVKRNNQNGIFLYPVSDTQFISYDGFFTDTFLSNKQGKIIKFIHVQRDAPNISFILWKEDSLILKAKNLLKNGHKTEALESFRKAYDQNPEHYYLANFIRYLEFIQSQEYEKLKPVIDTYSGKYGNQKLYQENNQIYYENQSGLIYKLLPISEDQFMVPNRIDAEVQIVKENNTIRGLKFIYRDGKEEFFSRNY